VLQEEPDLAAIGMLRPGQSAAEIADALVATFGALDVAETRLW
jgi:cytochrome c-type biogenesis protein CcmH/NrfF